jgi:hypothetical protein
VAILDFKIEITSLRELLMHSDLLVDPLLPEAREFKKLSGKRTKTESDHEEMARREYRASLYFDADGVVAIPDKNVMRCLIEGARVTKSGPKIERGCVLDGPHFALDYQGPTTVEGLYADRNFVSRMSVKVGTQKIMRCRPIFRRWGLTVTGIVDESVLSIDELGDIARNAGALIGLGDYRKGGGFGRFLATVTQTGVRG